MRLDANSSAPPPPRFDANKRVSHHSTCRTVAVQTSHQYPAKVDAPVPADLSCGCVSAVISVGHRRLTPCRSGKPSAMRATPLEPAATGRTNLAARSCASTVPGGLIGRAQTSNHRASFLHVVLPEIGKPQMQCRPASGTDRILRKHCLNNDLQKITHAAQTLKRSLRARARRSHTSKEN
jgi:hypothetical protein